jgi:P-type Ca2+ transporter type 2C
MENEIPSNQYWHSLKIEDALSYLKVDKTGLTSEEAQKRLARFGKNQLKEAKRPGFFLLLWGQLNNFVVILLIIASVVSALLGDYIEATAIMAIVVLNSILGIIQEQRAEQALAALKKLAAPDAQVIRDNKRCSIPSYNLVPGDIVFLEAGNFIPADLRLLETFNLRIEEASLTGESLPIQKNASIVLEKKAPLGDRKNTAFMGTIVNYGRGYGVVTNTGINTELGKIAEMLGAVDTEETPLQRRLDELGRILSLGSLILVVIVFVLALYNQTDTSGLFRNPFAYFQEFAGQITDVFIIAISLAIAAVPEGLPAVVTISLAMGMKEMIGRHVLIRKLSSVETLGSATVICSDKTGTLTQNEMTVTRIWSNNQFVEITGTGYTPVGEFFLNGNRVNINDYPAHLSTLWVGILNNDATIEKESNKIIGDPTEGSLVVAACKTGINHSEANTNFPRVGEIPFDSERKRMITIHKIQYPEKKQIPLLSEKENRNLCLVTVKGAPDIVLTLCNQYLSTDNKNYPLDETTKMQILAANNSMGEDALRVIGLAYRLEENFLEEQQKLNPIELEKNLIFVGLSGMIDPPHIEVKPALLQARNAGIRTIMITGDFPNTAIAIAKEIGLLQKDRKFMTGAELDKINNDELRKIINETDVFSRVSPEHKMRLVDALQTNDEIVAMTGDGVNDAPAIKRADIGVSMGITGTDVAKETADMVLTDDNYASIVAAVEQGRIIYSNIRKFVFFLLSSNVSEIMIIFLATLAGLPAPLTAIQLLWLNLITDGAPALALAMEKGDPDIMTQKPRAKYEPVVNTSMGIGIVIQTIMQTGAVLGAFVIGLSWHLEQNTIIPNDENWLLFILKHNWRGIDVQTAETMAFVTLSLAELFRAYTVRSERASVFQIGLFSNKYMQYAVGISLALLFTVCFVPFLQPIFNTHFLSLNEWLIVICLGLIPAIAEEITKLFLRIKK